VKQQDTYYTDEYLTVHFCFSLRTPPRKCFHIRVPTLHDGVMNCNHFIVTNCAQSVGSSSNCSQLYLGASQTVPISVGIPSIRAEDFRRGHLRNNWDSKDRFHQHTF